ncbi:MAG TPA: HAD family hydrolase [Chloroflexota bacterium]|nr:HAD family hydrolase [Chloroflexota bacterium]
MQTYLSLYPSIGVPAAPLFPGIKDTLDACRDSGLRLAIVTSKRHFLAQEILRATHIGAYFDVVIGADATAHHKPHPAPALAALERLELPPRAATVVGDATYDMLMARAAGCGAVGVVWGYGEETTLLHAGAEAIAGTPAELTALLV